MEKVSFSDKEQEKRLQQNTQKYVLPCGVDVASQWTDYAKFMNVKFSLLFQKQNPNFMTQFQ